MFVDLVDGIFRYRGLLKLDRTTDRIVGVVTYMCRTGRRWLRQRLSGALAAERRPRPNILSLIPSPSNRPCGDVDVHDRPPLL